MTLSEVLMGLALTALLMLGVMGALAPLLRWDLSLGLRRAATDRAETLLEQALAQARQRPGFEALADTQPVTADGLVSRLTVTQPATGLKQVTVTVCAASGGQLATLKTVVNAP